MNDSVQQPASTVQNDLPQDDAVQVGMAQKTQPVQNSQTDDNLNTFGEVLDEIGSVAPQSIVQAINESTDTLNPANPVRSSREKAEAAAALDTASIDAGGGVQSVETEKNPEIPVEVESFLHRVEDHQDQAPQEIVIADGTVETSKANYPSTPVVVLPITQEEEKKGEKKSPKYSFRWLVEWSHKIVKLFAGKVIYKVKEVNSEGREASLGYPVGREDAPGYKDKETE